eukprot:TRINITY_DN2656_c0_g1_i2.p1 TRINITY_DN2656_c0_g1~~TRINITY_DN2656_c0_g1_i2.p1  ORF type:complete len:147 (+),score=42.79 TRINITY_DN2656_c0_g1_i2:86-526(+)
MCIRDSNSGIYDIKNNRGAIADANDKTGMCVPDAGSLVVEEPTLKSINVGAHAKEECPKFGRKKPRCCRSDPATCKVSVCWSGFANPADAKGDDEYDLGERFGGLKKLAEKAKEKAGKLSDKGMSMVKKGIAMTQGYVKCITSSDN